MPPAKIVLEPALKPVVDWRASTLPGDKSFPYLQSMNQMKSATIGNAQDIKNMPARLYSDGMAAYQQGENGQAEKIFAQILAINPSHADAWNMRGVCCLKMSRLDEAETFIRKAITLKKDSAFYTNLGIALTQAQKTDEAAAAYRETLALNPDNAQACINLGNLLLKTQALEDAEALYRKAVKLKPDDARALANLGLLLVTRRNYDEAEQVLRRCLTINPALSKAAETLGMVLVQTRRWRSAEAVPMLEAAGAWGWLAENLRMRVAWDKLAQADTACINGLNQGHANTVAPLSLLSMPALTPQLQRKAALDFAHDQYTDGLQCTPLVNTVARKGTLRIGYLSADYYNHATMHLLAGVLEAHDPARVDIHLLSINPQRPAQDSDGYTRRVAAMRVTFHDLSLASDAQAAEQIASIAPHLLIDLKGYTGSARPNITARRPAPVIVNWLGYPGTLGHPRLADYIIGDPVVTPPEHAQDFSETLALMPHCYQPNDRSRPFGATVSRAGEGLPDSGFVFCSFNQYVKINPSTFDIWCRLLAVTPGSVLWLLDMPGQQEGQTHLKHEAQKRGIASDRLIFAPIKPLAEHLARLPLADLALDTFPYNSHTTASNALWAGVPLVTRIGQTFASRVAASLLTVHGFPELITSDDETYFKLALSLVNQPERLRHLRLRLDAARLNSPLFDTIGFTRDLERLYEAMWQQQSIPRDERPPLILQDA